MRCHRAGRHTQGQSPVTKTARKPRRMFTRGYSKMNFGRHSLRFHRSALPGPGPLRVPNPRCHGSGCPEPLFHTTSSRNSLPEPSWHFHRIYYNWDPLWSSRDFLSHHTTSQKNIVRELNIVGRLFLLWLRIDKTFPSAFPTDVGKTWTILWLQGNFQVLFLLVIIFFCPLWIRYYILSKNCLQPQILSPMSSIQLTAHSWPRNLWWRVNEVGWERNAARKKNQKDDSLPSACDRINKQTIEEPSEIKKIVSIIRMRACFSN